MNSEKLTDQGKEKDNGKKNEEFTSHLDLDLKQRAKIINETEIPEKRYNELDSYQKEVNSFFKFFRIWPSRKMKRNYALIKINPQEFKLFEKGNANFKWLIRETLELFLYTNPIKINDDLTEIMKEINENQENFKKEMDNYLKGA